MPYFAMRKKQADSCYSVYYYHFLAIYGAKAGLQPRTRDSPPQKHRGAASGPLRACAPSQEDPNNTKATGEYV